MEKERKILKILAIAIASLLIVSLTISICLQDKVADAILKSMSDKLLTKYDYSSVRLSLLRQFPKASLSIKDMTVLSSSNFDKRSFGGIKADTLLYAEHVDVEFVLWHLLIGEYNVDAINIKNGNLALLVDRLGFVNYELTEKSKKEEAKKFVLSLKKIAINNVFATYDNLATSVKIAGLIDKGTVKTRISTKAVDFATSATAIVDTIRVAYLNLSNTINTNIDLNIHNTDAGITFENSSLKFDKHILSLDGSISKDKELDLTVGGEGLNLARIKDYLPEGINKKLEGYNATGSLDINGTIKGTYRRTVLPSLAFNFEAKNSSIKHTGSNIPIKGFSIIGTYTNGSKQTSETSAIKIEDVKGAIGSFIFRGSMNLQNLETPNISIVLDGNGNTEDIANFFNTKYLTEASGDVALNLKAKGVYHRDKTYSLHDIFSFNPTLVVTANDFNVNLNNEQFVIEQVNGGLTITDDIIANNFSFKYLDQSILVNGSFKNLASWLSGKDVDVVAAAKVKADKLYLDNFVNQKNKKAKSDTKKPFEFPSDISFDFDVDVADFSYQDIKATDIKGMVSYKPTIFNLNTVSMNILDGQASITGFIVKNSDNTLLLRGTSNLNNINIHDAFVTFKDFGQTYLKAKNIEGNVTGNISALMTMTPSFKINKQTLTVEGDYNITNGALINFDPVKKLSKFVELSELENIRFERMKNDLIIKNNNIYFPQMDIKSSVADFSISGQHSFDNEYEYHIKLLLSEILSAKYKKNKKKNVEFGAVEDDGLGHTSILLAINNNGVKYDMKAAGERIRQEFQKEKQGLREIFREEYGTSNNRQNKTTTPAEAVTETEVKTTATEETKETDSNTSNNKKNTPRFKITWDDSPSN